MGKTDNGYADESEELFQGLQRGDHDAFNLLVERYEKKIFRIGYSYFHDKDEAMEIVQDTFLKVYRKIGTYQIGTRFSSWIYRIAANLCIDKYRKNQREQKQTMTLITRTPTVSEESPSRAALMSDKQRELRRAMESLTRRQKMVFSLKHFSYKKFDEISQIMGIANGTVKSLHFRAMNKIKKEISANRESSNE